MKPWTAAVTPPSTRRSQPLTNDAAGLASHCTAAAMSSAVPMRGTGEMSSIPCICSPAPSASSWRPMGVEMMPGLMLTTRPPRGPHATAACSIRSWLTRLATL